MFNFSSNNFCSVSATLATTAGIVLWLVSYYAPVLTLEPKYNSLSLGDKMASGMIPNVALYWAIKAMCSFEGKCKSRLIFTVGFWVAMPCTIYRIVNLL
jgi:hypothetical protein